MSSDLFPLFLAAAILAVVGLVIIVRATRSRGILDRILFGSVGVVLLALGVFLSQAVYPEWFDVRIATYKQFYGAVDVGMTRTEVLETKERLYPQGGLRQSPIVIRNTPASLGFHMDMEGADGPNCEGIFLHFEKGRVVRKHYSRD